MTTSPSTRPPLLLAAGAILLLVPLALPSTGLAGQGWIEPEPGLPAIGPFPVERLRTDVAVRIEGRVAHVEVEEWFENRGRGIAEGVYLYPLPGETAFQGYSLFQGDVELTGEMMRSDEARNIYEQIVRARKDPALIELVGHGLVRARVFPFEPGERRRITLRYSQLLDRAGDALALRYAAGPPTRAETRQGPVRMGGATGGQASGAPLTFTVTAEEGDRFLDPFSPTHSLRVSREEGELRIRPDGELTGRFSLFLPLAGAPVRLAVAAHRPSSDDGYFMLSLSPGELAESAVPRDVTMVVDVSGSMSGEKMEQTRRALLQLLGSLGPEDRFRLISFSSGVTTYRPGWTPAGADELTEAREWVRSLQAQGGTNIAGALEEAFREGGEPSRIPVVVFLTDGLPTVGERNPEVIADRADQLRGRSRVFAFGVGYDVDAYLLDRLTVAGRGSVQYVAPGEDVEHALGALAMQIRHPVLSDLELEALPVQVRDIFPSQIPDLFAGGELVLFGRYTTPGGGRASVVGTRDGRSHRFQAEVGFPEHHTANDWIPRLWATRKIGELTREVRLHGADPELIEEIRETALRYGILTEYTSYLVLEPDVVAGRPAVAPTTFEDGMLRRGRTAVTGAAASARAREARSSADVAEMEAAALAGSGSGRADVRVVAGRAFVLAGGMWTDRLHDAERRTIEVEAFSPAYFQLLEALPELTAWWRELAPVVVAGRRVSLAVVDEGSSPGAVPTLSGPELERLVREFRGR